MTAGSPPVIGQCSGPVMLLIHGAVSSGRTSTSGRVCLSACCCAAAPPFLPTIHSFSSLCAVQVALKWCRPRPLAPPTAVPATRNPSRLIFNVTAVVDPGSWRPRREKSINCLLDILCASYIRVEGSSHSPSLKCFICFLH